MKKLHFAHYLLLPLISLALLTSGNILWSQDSHESKPAKHETPAEKSQTETKEAKHEAPAEKPQVEKPEGESKEAESGEPAVKTKKEGVGLDMQVLTFKTIAELHSYMKTISSSLGVQCKFCHDLTAFEKNLPILKKNTARKMMGMTNEINEKYFAKLPNKISCFVCHQGRQEPVYSQESLDKVKKEETTTKEKVF